MLAFVTGLSHKAAAPRRLQPDADIAGGPAFEEIIRVAGGLFVPCEDFAEY